MTEIGIVCLKGLIKKYPFQYSSDVNQTKDII